MRIIFISILSVVVVNFPNLSFADCKPPITATGTMSGTYLSSASGAAILSAAKRRNIRNWKAKAKARYGPQYADNKKVAAGGWCRCKTSKPRKSFRIGDKTSVTGTSKVAPCSSNQSASFKCKLIN